MNEKINDDGVLWSRLSEVERQSASHTTELRSIYAGLDEIRDVLVRMQENAKPNLGGMFLVLLATCTFLVTIGGLTMAPVFRELGRINEMQNISSEILMERTGLIGRMQAKVEHIEYEMLQSEELSQERHGYQKDRMDRMQGQMDLLKAMAIDAQNRVSRVEGSNAPNWNKWMERKQ